MGRLKNREDNVRVKQGREREVTWKDEGSNVKQGKDG